MVVGGARNSKRMGGLVRGQAPPFYRAARSIARCNIQIPVFYDIYIRPTCDCSRDVLAGPETRRSRLLCTRLVSQYLIRETGGSPRGAQACCVTTMPQLSSPSSATSTTLDTKNLSSSTQYKS